METTNKIDYKALCEAPFDMDSTYEVNFRMLVYTGRKEEERPVFRVVIAKGECKVCIGAACKEFWGIVGLDPETGESQWKRWIRGWCMRRRYWRKHNWRRADHESESDSLRMGHQLAVPPCRG